MGVFDTSFDYKTDCPAGTDPDSNSPRLRADHELLWTKRLRSGAVFAPSESAARWNEYLIYTDDSEARHCYGSDAITSSYTGRSSPASLAEAMSGLKDDQRARYLDPPYTIGSAMIWPVRTKDKPTMNQARGFGAEGHQIADRMDLTLECIRRHYAGESDSPLANVITAYKDFFALFDGFREFVDFFHFQDLVTPDYKDIRFFVPFEGFEPSGIPADYITYREATLQFIAGRGRRMAEWVTEYHHEIEVCCPWWQPRRPATVDPDSQGGVLRP